MFSFRLFTTFLLPIIGFFLFGFQSGGFQLRKEDVRKAMGEMLGYHVEYKEFSPLIAKRSLKIFIEQFDPDKIYLLASEAKPYLEPRDEKIRTIIQNYYHDDLSEYEKINEIIQDSIVRAQRYRKELQSELIGNAEEPELGGGGGYVDYPRSEKELKDRIRRQLQRVLWVEKHASKLAALAPEQRKKIFALWERRFVRLENTYLRDVKTDHFLCMHVLKALAKSLDAHTSYYSPEEAHEMRTSLEKQFDGIGVVLRESIEGVVIHDMIKGGPAQRSGKINPGDLLVEVDGQNVINLPYEEVLKQLQGNGKGRILLGIRRSEVEAPEIIRIELKRERIVMQDDRVNYSFEPFGNGIIGKIDLPSFYESSDGSNCEIEMREAIRALKKQGNLIGLVLDMRENSGGFLNQAVKVAGLFVSSGIIVISKYAHGETQYLRDLDGRSYYAGPLVILTSKGSASAAEIVAQALQDYGTGIVVGDERTYGKGTIQYQTVTDSGATSFFKVTVGRYYTVSGRSTQIDGVQADLVVPTSYSGLAIGERYLEYPLKNDRIPSAYVDPLVDVDPRNKQWFQRNYLPTLQKKLSLWTQMLPRLQANSSYRLKQNKDFNLYLKAIEEEKNVRAFKQTAQQNWGIDDLQMIEAVNIVKDMAIIKPTRQETAFIQK
jgi:carboxyl-terminal processing protease